MFKIDLMNFDKKNNSTKIPSASHPRYTFNCAIKTPSSITNPIIEIGSTEKDFKPFYNYAYIEKFNRYYYITNITYDIGYWTLILSVDVLGTYKNDILNSRQYVKRSSSQYNPYLIDTMYHTFRDVTNECYYKSDSITRMLRYNSGNDTWVVTSMQDIQLKNGAFLVGIVGDNSTGVTYYIMPSATFRELLDKVFKIVPVNLGDLEGYMANSLINPIQYITICRWYPIMPLQSNTGTYNYTRYINIGGYQIDLGHNDTFCYVLDNKMIEKFRFRITLPSHPDVVVGATDYLNYNPYTEMNLYFQPFGNIPIDMTKSTDELIVYWYVDYCGGVSNLDIRNSLDVPIYTDTCEYGVPLPLASMVYDWKSALISGGLSWLKNTLPTPDYTLTGYDRELSTLISEDEYRQLLIDSGYTPKNTNTLDNLINITNASLGQLQTKGSSGSFLAYNMDLPFVYGCFNRICDEDVEKFGRPLEKVVRLDQLQGYIICANASLPFSDKMPLNVEHIAIINALNSGVYIE